MCFLNVQFIYLILTWIRKIWVLILNWVNGFSKFDRFLIEVISLT